MKTMKFLKNKNGNGLFLHKATKAQRETEKRLKQDFGI